MISKIKNDERKKNLPRHHIFTGTLFLDPLITSYNARFIFFKRYKKDCVFESACFWISMSLCAIAIVFLVDDNCLIETKGGRRREPQFIRVYSHPYCRVSLTPLFSYSLTHSLLSQSSHSSSATPSN